MKPRTVVIGASACAVLFAAVVLIYMRSSRGGKVLPPPQPPSRTTLAATATPLAEPKWVKGQRITVEILNATKIRGLARRAARALRDQGFDVVSTGTNRVQLDTTQVLDRTGHRDWAALAANAMGGGTVLVRPDSSREVDLTVLIGATWRPPSQSFYP